MNEIDWIDLPEDDYKGVLGYETENVEELNILIAKYSQIPKDQIPTISCRIKKLNKIIDFLKDWIDNRLESIDKKKHLIWISEIANKKRNYLIQLFHIYSNQLHLQASLTSTQNDISDLYDSTKTCVILNNQRFFSLKLREYWGDFWYESLDPCHRRLTPFLDQWKILLQSNPETPDFFLWLENQHLPKYIPRVKYLVDDALEMKRVIIKDGLFWEKSDSEWALANFDNCTKRYLFSISLKGDIYISEEESGISHSSFTCGKPVLGAGLVQIKEGILTSLALESGHYLPTVEIGYQILEIFEEKGALFPTDLEIIFFFDRNKYKSVINAKNLPTLEQFKNILNSSCTTNHKGCHETSAK